MEFNLAPIIDIKYLRILDIKYLRTHIIRVDTYH